MSGNAFDGLNQYIEDAKEWNTSKVNIPLSLLEALLLEHADLLEALERIKAECFVVHHIEGPEKNVHDILEMANNAIQKAQA